MHFVVLHFVSLPSRMAALQEAECHLVEWGLQLTHVMTTFEAHKRDIFADRVEARGLMIDEAIRLLQLGGTRRYEEIGHSLQLPPFKEDGSIAFNVLVRDGCLESTDVAECRSIDNGVLTGGAIAATYSMLSYGREVTAAARTNATIRAFPRPLGFEPRLYAQYHKTFRVFLPYLRHALRHAAEDLEADIGGTLDSTIIVLRILNWSFVAAFLVFTFLVYTASVRAVLDPLRSARQMLRLIPTDALDSLPALREELEDVVTRPNDTSGKALREQILLR